MRLLTALALLLAANLLHADSIAPLSGDKSDRVTDLIARNQMGQAHEFALSWQEGAPENATAAFWVGSTAGQMAMRSGMFKAMGYAKTSRKALEKAVELNAKDIRAQFLLMQFYLMAPGIMGGDKDEAKLIAQRIALQSKVDGLRAQGQILATEKDMDGWLRENRAALELAPAHPDILGSVTGYYLGKSDFAAAKTLIDAAKAVDPDHPVVRYQYVKWAAMSGQESEEALAIIDEMLKMPRYPDRFSLSGAHLRRGQLLAKLGRKDQAISAYEACLTIDPELKGVNEELEALRKA